VILLLLLAIGFCVKNALGNGDFKVFLEAAKLVGIGESPYNKWLHVGGDGYCLYFYSPLWALILVPFNIFQDLFLILSGYWQMFFFCIEFSFC
jgi:hypothetical protein